MTSTTPGRYNGWLMRRRLYRVASALSLLLCVASIVLWVRSYQYAEEFAWRPTATPTQRRVFSLEVTPGQIVLDCETHTRTRPEPDWDESGSREIWYQNGFEWLTAKRNKPARIAGLPTGFRWERSVSTTPTRGAQVLIAATPIWPVSSSLFILTLPLAWGGWPWRRKANTCAGCGYNLTGNISGVCPECGMKIQKPICA